MSIEIKGSNGRPPIDPGEAAVGGARSGGSERSSNATTSVSGSSADTFSLTNKASQLRQLEAQIAQAPVVDTQRVQEMRENLLTGTWLVQPARVADKLLQFELGLNPAAASA